MRYAGAVDEEDRDLLTEIRDMLKEVLPILKEYEPLLKRFAHPVHNPWKR
jgi:hypothetical protein